MSGPFLDRIDLTIETQPVTALDLASPPSGEESATVAKRVLAAREIQRHRATETDLPALNARLTESTLSACATPNAAGQALLTRACESLHLSARAYTRILRVARTLADLDEGDGVSRRHISEAISFRRQDEPHSLSGTTTASLSK